MVWGLQKWWTGRKDHCPQLKAMSVVISYWLMVSFRWGSFLGSPNFHLPSGKHTKKLLQMAVYSWYTWKKMIFHSYVSLPEGYLWHELGHKMRQNGLYPHWLVKWEKYDKTTILGRSQRILTVPLPNVPAKHIWGWEQPFMNTSWWFGTWILFFHLLGMSSSQLTFIFIGG